jgi:hypothetical protein
MEINSFYSVSSEFSIVSLGIVLLFTPTSSQFLSFPNFFHCFSATLPRHIALTPYKDTLYKEKTFKMHLHQVEFKGQYQCVFHTKTHFSSGELPLGVENWRARIFASVHLQSCSFL